MRTIIRFSLDTDTYSALGQKLTKILVDAGFVHTPKTSTYECTIDMPVLQLGQVLQSFWQTVTDHVTNNVGPGRFDHFWMYSDKQPSDSSPQTDPLPNT